MSKLSALQHLGLAYETAYGTAVVPSFWLPVSSAKPQDEIKKIADEGRRANLSKTFAVYDGVTSSTFDVEFDCYPDAIGYLLKAIMGQDVVTGSAPYFHKFQVVNALAPSLTLSYFNGIAEHAYAGSVLSELSLKFDTESVVTATGKFDGIKGAPVATTTPSFSPINAFMGWGSSLKIGGASNTNMVGGEIDIKREVKLLYGANNSQSPNKFSSGRIDMTGKFTFDVEDEAELALLGSGLQTLDFILSQDANHSLEFSFSAAHIDKATIDTSQEFVRVDLEFSTVYNVTDAGIATISLKNSVASY